MRWSHRIITPATVEVLSLEDAKAELDVDFNDDDALIAGHLLSAVGAVESFTNRFLAPTEVELLADAWASHISLPFAPVYDPPTISYLSGAAMLPLTGFRTIPGEPFTLLPGAGTRWPGVPAERGSVRITFTVGYPEGQVPPVLLQAVRLALRAFYEAPAGPALEAELAAVATVARPYKFASL